jgi:ABC-type glycerol-3-phosphate transport system substrate-binding protein
MPVEFDITTAAAKQSIVGDRTAWTISDLKELMKQYPDSESFTMMSGSEFFTLYVSQFGGNFMDTYAGTCNFESEEFIELLEWMSEFPEEIDYSSYEDYYLKMSSLYREDKVLLNWMGVSSFDEIKRVKNNYFGVPVTLIGFPTANGNGSVLKSSKLFAMSAQSSCKEGAWQFIRYFLSDEYQESSSLWSLPVKVSALEKQAESACERPYYLDENGNRVEYDRTYQFNGTEIADEPLTEEEADRYLAFIRSVNQTIVYDQSLLNIISEEVGAFFQGQKTAAEVAKIIQSRAKIYMAENY